MYRNKIIFLLFFIYISKSSYIYQGDGNIQDAHKELIEHIENINDINERKNIIDFSLQYNLISEEESRELLN